METHHDTDNGTFRLKIFFIHIQKIVFVVQEMFIGTIEVQQYMNDSLLNGIIHACVGDIEDMGIYMHKFNQMFIHEQHLRIFICDDVQAVISEPGTVVIKEKISINMMWVSKVGYYSSDF